MSRLNAWTGLLATLALIAVACTPGAGPTTRPASQPVATGTAAASEPAESEPAESEPAESEPAGGLEGSLTLWHTYSSGAGTELDALNEVLETVRADNPGLQLEIVEQPFEGVFDRYGLEVAGGGGPDLFIAPNDSLGQLSRDGTILALDEYVGDQISGLKPLAVEGSNVDGVLYQVPESLKAVAMYYDSEAVATPPATTDELLAAVQAGDLTLGLLGGEGIYHEFGWWGAFGGGLMDENGVCIADQGGVAEAFSYLQDLQEAGATFYPVYDDLANDFKEGEVDAIVDGPWAAGGYVADVPTVAVAPMPAGPGGPSLPLTGVDGWLVNPGTADPQLAVDVALALTSADAQQVFANTAYHIPGDPTIAIDDPISEQFATAVESGLARPQNVELNNFWANFNNTLAEVLEAGADPETSVATACAAMNEANGK